MVLKVTDSPFSQEQVELLNQLLPTLSEVQKVWLSGYLAALHKVEAPLAAGFQATSAANGAVISKEVTVLFGSQSGNSQKLAKVLTGKLQEHGFHVTLSAMSDFKTNALKKVENLLVVVSTHGDGEPPDNAISFHEFLHSKRAPQLEGLRFSVLALGDTSYEWFCQTGKEFDKRLEELGGKRLTPRVDCDVDYDEHASEWMNQVLASLSETTANQVAAASAIAGSAVIGSGSQTEYSRSNPFQAVVLENLNLNGRGSDKETRHLEISLEGSSLEYEPGDCLGIYPRNHPDLVRELIDAMGWKPEELVPIHKSGEERTLEEALSSHFEITVLTKPLLEQAGKLSSGNGLRELLAEGQEQKLRDYVRNRDLLDLVEDYDLKGVSSKEFVSILRKLPPRLYSISSSLKSYPDEVHLTIRNVHYQAHGRDRYGVCSSYIADRLEAGDTLPVFVQHNPNFKLPANPDTPLIMIGPGTGVAPFRAFLGEREELGATGKTWLFFGDQHFSTDFLYQLEWQRWLKQGVLTHMDVAFSRDTSEKVYVQHRMLEKSRELYQWLQDGAHVYVCGDEKRMAHDVHAALVTILQQEGGLDSEEAVAYLKRMQQEKRYQRDVY
ncbi:assimilatory sulfite reductase (NADPH) flavoprotein subunit [Brevibacillus sp. HB1.3]|uniref:assimilatory sulfite reductase (NADPH) flavoprotein subunit n=1 Tax=Brevibacillus sp. HB1.3 TaxID=2738842 RepID=UPI0015524D22|nr:assimilatory sulfite reductase (NADPH) flavoprotein subunit [Brevibacillus sp. HB1.3]NQF13728.1 assimilatory sulfite reductase (NADPH) flavoprotein subunit [Brevibacillus sp. HB1.3]